VRIWGFEVSSRGWNAAATASLGSRIEQGEWHETAYVSSRGDGRAFRLRDHAPAPCHADLRRRNVCSGDAALSASTAAANDCVPGWDQRSRGCELPASAASASPAATAAARPRRRTRLSFKGRRAKRRPKLVSRL
jgi:hypothetical protein